MVFNKKYDFRLGEEGTLTKDDINALAILMSEFNVNNIELGPLHNGVLSDAIETQSTRVFTPAINNGKDTVELFSSVPYNEINPLPNLINNSDPVLLTSGREIFYNGTTPFIYFGSDIMVGTGDTIAFINGKYSLFYPGTLAITSKHLDSKNKSFIFITEETIPKNSLLKVDGVDKGNLEALIPTNTIVRINKDGLVMNSMQGLSGFTRDVLEPEIDSIESFILQRLSSTDNSNEEEGFLSNSESIIDLRDAVVRDLLEWKGLSNVDKTNLIAIEEMVNSLAAMQLDSKVTLVKNNYSMGILKYNRALDHLKSLMKVLFVFDSSSFEAKLDSLLVDIDTAIVNYSDSATVLNNNISDLEDYFSIVDDMVSSLVTYNTSNANNSDSLSNISTTLVALGEQIKLMVGESTLNTNRKAAVRILEIAHVAAFGVYDNINNHNVTMNDSVGPITDLIEFYLNSLDDVDVAAALTEIEAKYQDYLDVMSYLEDDDTTHIPSEGFSGTTNGAIKFNTELLSTIFTSVISKQQLYPGSVEVIEDIALLDYVAPVVPTIPNVAATETPISQTELDLLTNVNSQIVGIKNDVDNFTPTTFTPTLDMMNVNIEPLSIGLVMADSNQYATGGLHDGITSMPVDFLLNTIIKIGDGFLEYVARTGDLFSHKNGRFPVEYPSGLQIHGIFSLGGRVCIVHQETDRVNVHEIGISGSGMYLKGKIASFVYVGYVRIRQVDNLNVILNMDTNILFSYSSHNDHINMSNKYEEAYGITEYIPYFSPVNPSQIFSSRNGGLYLNDKNTGLTINHIDNEYLTIGTMSYPLSKALNKVIVPIAFIGASGGVVNLTAERPMRLVTSLDDVVLNEFVFYLAPFTEETSVSGSVTIDGHLITTYSGGSDYTGSISHSMVVKKTSATEFTMVGLLDSTSVSTVLTSTLQYWEESSVHTTPAEIDLRHSMADIRVVSRSVD